MDKFKTPKICIGDLMPDKGNKENHLKIEQENLQLQYMDSAMSKGSMRITDNQNIDSVESLRAGASKLP